jgi:radical SAM family uncharacterized protein
MSINGSLISVRRPGRYIGREWNIPEKNPSKIKLSICLCFPEVYEVGMSHLGLRILYDILNSKKEILCERSFCPWPDFKQLLLSENSTLSSLESDIPLRDFDILGFSINNELNYTNILTMLSSGGIPFKSKDRDNSFPLIIGGGNCTLNPEPIADFFDLFVVGEAEDVILDIARICKVFKNKYGHISKSKQDLLLELCQLPGIYVPSFYRVEYDNKLYVKEFSPINKSMPKPIRKVYVKDLNKQRCRPNWVVPNIEIVHDRIGIEIMRGCLHKCRFCQARNYFFPLRIRSAKRIISLAKKLYKLSGYEQISLLSLSSSDHPQIKKIVESLIRYFTKKAVSIALPSIRARHIVGELSSLLSLNKKTGLTFAPEAGTEKLRRIINKNINIDELFLVARDAFKSGYRRIKLYFMIGLPGEDYSDLDAIIEMSHKISMLRKEFSSQAAEVSLSISTFIPKPHTPFQWLGMDNTDSIIKKQEYLKSLVCQNRYRLKLNFHDIYMSKLEAVLSRGNRQLSEVILSAFNKGSQYDQWQEHFNFSNWRNALLENSLDFEEITSKELEMDNDLIWDFIDIGVNKQHLADEFRKAFT